MKLLKPADTDLDINQFVTDKCIRAAFSQAEHDYDAELKNYSHLPLRANDAVTGAPISDFGRVAQNWVKDEPKVRHSGSPVGISVQAMKRAISGSVKSKRPASLSRHELSDPTAVSQSGLSS
ncbi:hypothetical protein LRP30_30870 [Bradyrhizobium sp. C-145]|uniref:hypothetical protein n=1 Tax=Bradyrhizobium sp. C-145 TaxID=574727 RepID=UPI00201B78D0|nr:hypothetical protein [Bradyrhizobium sp. C-145]UQR61324.1 hypothetical protein LRP30_30870 [Bradyrhizobium sp. C-145]